MLRAGNQAARAGTATAGTRPAALMPPALPPCHAALLDRGGIPPASLPALDGLPDGAPIRAALPLHLGLSPRPISRQCRQGRATVHGSRQSAVVRMPGRLLAVPGPRALPSSSRPVRRSRMPRSRQGPSLRGRKGRDGRGCKLPARFGQNQGANAASDPRIAATSFGPALGRAQGVLRTRQRGPRAASRGCVACALVSRQSLPRPVLRCRAPWAAGRAAARARPRQGRGPRRRACGRRRPVGRGACIAGIQAARAQVLDFMTPSAARPAPLSAVLSA